MATPRRQLTLFDSTSIIVGIIVGVGFFESTAQVVRGVGGFWSVLGVWAAGGVMALLGALCYAELTAAYPRDGGEYVFLTRAFGRRAGFLFAWASFWVVRPGNIGAMAYVFARYASQLYRPQLGQYAFAAYAVASVLVLSALNVLGLRSGKWTQNLLTAAKVAGLVAVFCIGLFGRAAPAGAGATERTPDGLHLAMILVMFAYGGWNEMSYVAAEVRDPRRNVLRALVLGTVAVVAIYLVGNVAFIRALGLGGVARSEAVATEVLRRGIGDRAAAAMSALVCVAALGALNGMLLTGSRIYYAVGAEHPAYSWLGRWDGRRGSPAGSLLLQAAVTVAVVAGFGLNLEGFERLVVLTAPLYWLFLLLGGVSLFVLRRLDAKAERPYRVAAYPLTPLLFCASSAYLLFASIEYAWRNRAAEMLWGLGLMAAGVLASLYDPGENPRGKESEA